ncbi:hypothetical protein [Agarivorans sp. QJM3NY_25]|uniref:hypothetical protein n=1 Tax=Agarivorans sp. QJM3NY_25 TaxID=3421430 RepID=UPI003D7C8302
MMMLKWMIAFLLFSPFGFANQLSLKVIEGAYPLLSLTIDQAQSVKLSADGRYKITLPTSSSCLSDTFQQLSGRLVAVQLTLDQIITQQLQQLSQTQNWLELSYMVDFPSSELACSTAELQMIFPPLTTFASAWGKFEVNQGRGSQALSFFVLHKFANDYRWQAVLPEPQRAQQFWLDYYAQMSRDEHK